MTTRPVQEKVPALPPSEAAAADAPAEDRAWAEAALFSRGAPIDDMEDEAKRNEHGRNQRFRNQFEYIAIAALWLASAAVTIIGGIWLWHLVAPPQGRWLTTSPQACWLA